MFLFAKLNRINKFLGLYHNNLWMKNVVNQKQYEIVKYGKFVTNEQKFCTRFVLYCVKFKLPSSNRSQIKNCQIKIFADTVLSLQKVTFFL